jgi:hypothetical protein
MKKKIITSLVALLSAFFTLAQNKQPLRTKGDVETAKKNIRVSFLILTYDSIKSVTRIFMEQTGVSVDKNAQNFANRVLKDKQILKKKWTGRLADVYS